MFEFLLNHSLSCKKNDTLQPPVFSGTTFAVQNNTSLCSVQLQCFSHQIHFNQREIQDTPRIYTEQQQYFSYKIHFNQRKTQSNDRLYLDTVVTISYPVHTKDTRVQKTDSHRNDCQLYIPVILLN